MSSKFKFFVSAPPAPTPPPVPPVEEYWLDVNRTDGLAESDRVALTIFYAEGMSASAEHMTTAEAGEVLALPSFANSAGLVKWDWSALAGLNAGADIAGTFMDCAELDFEDIGEIFGTQADNMERAFEGCTSLALSTLPAGFGAVATNMEGVFNGCTSLALSTLPAGFGEQAETLKNCFTQCTSITLSALPAGFGAQATNITSLFNLCTSITLSTLPAGFGAQALEAESVFAFCLNITISALPAGFGAQGRTFGGLFRNCSAIEGNFNLNSEDFGGLSSNWGYAFHGTHITSFTGRFNFGGARAEARITNIFPNMPAGVALEVRFVPNVIQMDWSTILTNMVSLSKQSLLSLCDSLAPYDTRTNVLTITPAQYATIETELYNDNTTYLQYIRNNKKWYVTTG